jgi:hypothetical protein
MSAARSSVSSSSGATSALNRVSSATRGLRGGTRLYVATPEPGYHSQPLLYFMVLAIDDAYV